MADRTAIEWTEATWNPTTGCDRVSPGCDHCYALTLARRLKAMGNPRYQSDGDPRTSGTGFGLSLHDDLLERPKSWRAPRLVFVNSMSDLFHPSVPDDFIRRVFEVMADTPRHTYQVLTKRSRRLAELAPRLPWPENVWMGVSVETSRYRFRVDDLRRVPAVVRFLSLEPLLGPLPDLDLDDIHWVIVGGESGPESRPVDTGWVRTIRDRCVASGVPFFFKQWGGRTAKAGGRELDGRVWDELPIRRMAVASYARMVGPPGRSDPGDRSSRGPEEAGAEPLFSDEDMKAMLVEDARELRISEPRRAVEAAREFGGWTLNKLEVLDLYLKVFRRVAGNGSYIDGFAGTGEVRIGGETLPGSATRAARSGVFKHLFLYERPSKAKQLRSYLDANLAERLSERCRVRGGDFNELVVEDLESGVIPVDKPCFAFLDQDSTQLDWATIERLATYKDLTTDEGAEDTDEADSKVLKVELWILFNTHQAVMRLLPKHPPPGYEQSPEAQTLDRIMGDRNAWWDLYTAGVGPGQWAMRFAERLSGELGYGAAVPHRILDPKTGRPQYYMIHASDHPAAFSFMRWAKREAAADQSWTTPLKGFDR